jgi:hypothetical protein
VCGGSQDWAYHMCAAWKAIRRAKTCTNPSVRQGILTISATMWHFICFTLAACRWRVAAACACLVLLLLLLLPVLVLICASA